MARGESRALRAAAPVEVEVVYCSGRGQSDHCLLSLPEGSVLKDALAASGLFERHAGLAEATDAASGDSRAGVGVWGKLAPLDQLLVHGDRVEVYRPLVIEPKDARRLRHRRQRATKSRQAQQDKLRPAPDSRPA